MTGEARESRRAARLAAYRHYRQRHADRFRNPTGAAYEILDSSADQTYVADRLARRAAENGAPEESADIGLLYRDEYVTLLKDPVRFRNGERGTYLRLCASNDGEGAAILPVLDDGRIVLLWHFRHADRAWHWEIPRGFGEAGAEGVDTARRELHEELGCEISGPPVYLGAINSNTGMSADEDKIYLAYLSSASLSTTPSPNAVLEGIDEIRPVDCPTLRSMIDRGEITDAFTLAAFAFAVVKGLLPAG